MVNQLVVGTGLHSEISNNDLKRTWASGWKLPEGVKIVNDHFDSSTSYPLTTA